MRDIKNRFCQILLACVWLNPYSVHAQPATKHNLHFEKLAGVWDEALPLGNGTIGALVWEREGKLRFSLDRADVWDMRPMAGLHREEFSYKWVQEQVRKKDYKPVQQYFDAPYDREPAPSKIPAGALEFELPGGPGTGWKVKRADVLLASASAEVEWSNGMVLRTFVHATEPVGWFRFENVPQEMQPRIAAPRYSGTVKEGGEVNSLVGDDLARLGYKQGTITNGERSISYRQEGWGGFSYEVAVRWKPVRNGVMEGV